MGRPCACCGCHCKFGEKQADKMTVNHTLSYRSVYEAPNFVNVPVDSGLVSVAFEEGSTTEEYSPWNCKGELSPDQSPARYFRETMELLTKPSPPTDSLPDIYYGTYGSITNLSDGLYVPPSPYELVDEVITGLNVNRQYLIDGYDNLTVGLAQINHARFFPGTWQPDGAKKLLKLRCDYKRHSGVNVGSNRQLILTASYTPASSPARYIRTSTISVTTSGTRNSPIPRPFPWVSQDGWIGYLHNATGLDFTEPLSEGLWRRIEWEVDLESRQWATPGTSGQTELNTLDVTATGSPIQFGVGFLFPWGGFGFDSQVITGGFASPLQMQQRYIYPFDEGMEWDQYNYIDNVCINISAA